MAFDPKTILLSSISLLRKKITQSLIMEKQFVVVVVFVCFIYWELTMENDQEKRKILRDLQVKVTLRCVCCPYCKGRANE